MPRVGFEPTIPVLERVNIFHALDGAATVIGLISSFLRLYRHVFFLTEGITKMLFE
jgi:hypothetical protein